MNGQMREEWYVQTGSMFENPWGVPHDEIRRFIKENPPEVVAQVVFGRFVDSSGLVFTAELINELIDHSIPNIVGDAWIDRDVLKQYRAERDRFEQPYRFAHGIDLARRKDYTVIFVIDNSTRPARVVYYRRLNRVPWDTIYAEIGKALYYFPGEQLVDATGTGGDIVLEELNSRLYCPLHNLSFNASSSCSGRSDGRQCDGWIRLSPEGYSFTAASKVQLVNHLQNVLGFGYDVSEPEKPFGALRCPPILALQEELTEYAWDDKKLQTDCVMALALSAYQAIQLEVEDILAVSPFGS